MTDTAYHLVGVGGIGMSAIARLLLARGAQVSGSDVHRSPLVEQLAAEGVAVTIGHRAANVGAAGVVVVSSAIAYDNPEFVAAVERKLDVVTRGAMLAELARGHKLVAVAGTHGKTTTTAMLATIFETAGLDPTVAVGGLRLDTGSNARAGGGSWFITESDESDGSFLCLNPTIAVVNNVENDHIASDDELPRLLEQFMQFVNKVPADGRVVVGSDNRGSRVVAGQAFSPVTTFATRARRRSDRDRPALRRAGLALRGLRSRSRAGRDRAARSGRDQRAQRARRDRRGARRRDSLRRHRRRAGAVSRRAAPVRGRRPRLADGRRRLRSPPDRDRADDRRGTRVRGRYVRSSSRSSRTATARTKYLKDDFARRCTAPTG